MRTREVSQIGDATLTLDYDEEGETRQLQRVIIATGQHAVRIEIREPRRRRTIIEHVLPRQRRSRWLPPDFAVETRVAQGRTSRWSGPDLTIGVG